MTSTVEPSPLDCKISCKEAKLILPLKHELSDLFMCSFSSIIAFGCINNTEFVNHNYFSIPYNKFDAFFQICVQIIQFFSTSSNLKEIENAPDFEKLSQTIVEKCVFKSFSCISNNAIYLRLNHEQRKVSFVKYNDTNKNHILFIVHFDIETFCSFLLAFKIAIIPSFNLTLEQNLFFNYILRKDINLENLQKNSSNIIQYVLNFLENYPLKSKQNYYFIELFDFYYETLLFITKLDILLKQLSTKRGFI